MPPSESSAGLEFAASFRWPRAEMEGAAGEDEAFSSGVKAFSTHFEVFDDLLWRQNVRHLVLQLLRC